LIKCHWFARQSQRCHQKLATGCIHDGWPPLSAAILLLCRFIGKAEPAIVVALYFHTSTMMLSALPLFVFSSKTVTGLQPYSHSNGTRSSRTHDGWLPLFAGIFLLCRFIGKAEPAIVVALSSTPVPCCYQRCRWWLSIEQMSLFALQSQQCQQKPFTGYTHDICFAVLAANTPFAVQVHW
jgi:hypothetical protein